MFDMCNMVLSCFIYVIWYYRILWLWLQAIFVAGIVSASRRPVTQCQLLQPLWPLSPRPQALPPCFLQLGQRQVSCDRCWTERCVRCVLPAISTSGPTTGELWQMFDRALCTPCLTCDFYKWADTRWVVTDVGQSAVYAVTYMCSVFARVLKKAHKLQTSVYEILPPTTAISDCTIGLQKLSVFR